MRNVLSILSLMSVLSTPAFANVGDAPSFVGSPQDVANLVDAIKAGTPAAASATVTCSNVIVVHTGGTMGSATAGQCSIAGRTVLECLNNMVGNTGLMSEPQAGITLESSLRELIDAECTGG